MSEEEITNTKAENDKSLESQRAVREEDAKGHAKTSHEWSKHCQRILEIARKETTQLKDLFSD